MGGAAPVPATEAADAPPAPATGLASHEVLWWVVGAVAAVFAVFYTVPWQPAAQGPIGAFDFSWMQVLHDAVATGRQFGSDIILPQGPLGFIGNGVYDPRTYGVLIAARTALALATCWALWTAARKLLPSQPLIALPWLLTIVALIGWSPDHFFPACAVLLLFNYFVVDGRTVGRTVYALAVVLAAASLIKVNQPFFAAASIGTVMLDRLAQRDRRFFLLPLAYLGLVALFYLAARQSPGSVGPFLWGWLTVTAGHIDAVGLGDLWIDAVAYLLVVAAVVAGVAMLAWRTWRRPGLLLPLGTAAVLLLLYKHSFMRQDKVHVHMGPMVAAAAAVLYLPALFRAAGGGALRAGGLVAIGLAFTVLHSILSSYNEEGEQGLHNYAAAVANRCGENALAAASHFTDPPRLRREWEAARAQLRAENPLPRHAIREPVDVYPHRQNVVFAHGLKYAPRPVISSLVATAPALAELNAEHLRSREAAPTVLFEVELVDSNYPTMLDGRSLPELLTRYDVADASGAMLVLRRSASPRSYHFTPLATRVARFDEPVPIPELDGGPIWARVRFKRRVAGRVLSMLYKPPMLGIEVQTRDGAAAAYRLLPTLAEEHGFLLSPLIADRAAYAALASKSWKTDLAPAAVTAMTVYIAHGSQEATFDPEFEIELQRLEFER